MSMILLEPAYKISRSEIKRRTISVTPFFKHYDSGFSRQDTSVAKHCGALSLALHAENPKMKLDERDSSTAP